MIDLWSKSPKSVLKEFSREFAPKIVRSSATRAINRTLTTVRASASRKIREDLKIKAADAKDAFVVEKAQAKGPVKDIYGQVIVRGKPLPLALFSPKEKMIKVRDNFFGNIRWGVTVNVKGQRKLVKGGFLHQLPSGRLAVLVRKGDKRYPLQEARTTSVVDILRNKGVIKELLREARATLVKNLEAELRYQTQKAASKASGGDS